MRGTRGPCTLLGIPERTFVEGRRLFEQRAHPLSALSLLIGLRRGVLVLELDVEAIRKPLDRPDEVEALGLADERDHVAADAAPEAVIRASVGR